MTRLSTGVFEAERLVANEDDVDVYSEHKEELDALVDIEDRDEIELNFFDSASVADSKNPNSGILLLGANNESSRVLSLQQELWDPTEDMELTLPFLKRPISVLSTAASDEAFFDGKNFSTPENKVTPKGKKVVAKKKKGKAVRQTRKK